MNHWPFIIAAYSIVVLSTAALILWSYASMRRTEAALDQLRRK